MIVGPTAARCGVLPGSHRCGWLDDQLDEWKQRVPERSSARLRTRRRLWRCVLFLLHASAKSTALGHRRRSFTLNTLCEELPEGLEWKNRVGAWDLSGLGVSWDKDRVVRRGKVLVFSGCNSHPATGSLQPVAIGAVVEGNKTAGAFETRRARLGGFGRADPRRAGITRR